MLAGRLHNPTAVIGHPRRVRGPGRRLGDPAPGRRAVAGALTRPLTRPPARPRTPGWRAVGRRGTVVAVTTTPFATAPRSSISPTSPTSSTTSRTRPTSGRSPRPSVVEAVYVPTQTAGYDGDYGYDLAHEVPGR